MSPQRVQPGQRYDLQASDINAAREALAYVQAQRRSQRARSGGGGLQSGIVRVRNDSGSPRSQFDVLGITGVIIEAADNLAEFQQRCRICLVGAEPAAAHAGKFVVLLEPLADGAIGAAVAAGVVQCQVDVQAEGDEYAEVASGSYALASAASGTARILHVPAGTGTQWAVVRLGNAVAGETGGTGDGSGVLIDAAHKLYHTWEGEDRCWVEGPQPVDGNGDPIAGEWRTDIRGRIIKVILSVSMDPDGFHYWSQWPHAVAQSVAHWGGSDFLKLGYAFDETEPNLPDEDPVIVACSGQNGTIDEIEVRMDRSNGFLYLVNPNTIVYDPSYVYAHVLAIGSRSVVEPDFQCDGCDEAAQGDASASGDADYGGTYEFASGPNWGSGDPLVWTWAMGGTAWLYIRGDGPYTVSTYSYLTGGTFEASGVPGSQLRCLDGQWTGTVELAGQGDKAGSTLTVVFGGA